MSAVIAGRSAQLEGQARPGQPEDQQLPSRSSQISGEQTVLQLADQIGDKSGLLGGHVVADQQSSSAVQLINKFGKFGQVTGMMSSDVTISTSDQDYHDLDEALTSDAAIDQLLDYGQKELNNA